jgi:hypothetical protein
VARLLRARGAPLGAVYTYLSSLYFRGKLAYAQVFARGPVGAPGARIITPAEGLVPVHERVTVDRLRAWAEVEVDANNPRFTGPLVASAAALDAEAPGAAVVLLGSIATDKYLAPLASVFGERLLCPRDFAGRGDMSRGALLLQAVREGRELPYVPVAPPPPPGRGRG